jgi:hypothetical protein
MIHTREAQLVEELRQATADLLYTSESDSAFVVFTWPGCGPPESALLARYSGHPPDAPVAEVDFEDFFRPLTGDQDWHGPEERRIVERYRHLEALLRTHLSDLRVFRLGEVEVHIFIFGCSRWGNRVGLSTQAIET